jgi:D-alanyl-D-alanine carboxypeptidase
MMTAKARQLGMTGTIFRNAHGLPNPAQHSTARDLATLGVALREHFPQYYPYFSTKSFTYGKQRLGNHNRLLGRVKGVDGIKTGYTRASGFNLVSSVSDGNRRIVAVVMGGNSGSSRDKHMAELIQKYLPKASTRRGGALIAKTGNSPIQAFAGAILPKRNAPTPDFRPEEDVVAEMAEPVAAPKPMKRPADPVPVVVEQAYAAPDPARMADLDPVSTASVAASGWVIQVASSPSEVEARAFLAKTNQQVPSVLANASAYTLPFDKDGVTYYRARFSGFSSKTAAWNACSALKKKKIACYAIEQ